MVCLQAAFVLSYWARLGFSNPYANVLYQALGVLIEAFDLVVLLLFRTLSGVRKRGFLQEFIKTLQHTLWLLAAGCIYLFSLQKGGLYSRVSFFLMYLFYFVLTYLVRVLWKAFINGRRGSVSGRSLLIVTTSSAAAGIIKRFRQDEFSRILISGLAIVDRDLRGEEIEGISVVACRESLPEYVCRKWVDEVFIKYPSDELISWELVRQIAETGVIIHLNMIKDDNLPGRQQMVQRLGGYTVVTSTMNTMTTGQAFVKRLIDIVGGLAGCLVTAILFIFIAPVVHKKSPGPIFFKQERIGQNGKKFKMYKFRSMYLDAEERKKELLELNRVKDGMMFKMEFDPRVIGNEILEDGTRKTGIGDFIRRTSLDEFPQFFNVLKGDMSLVGTRPPTVDEWEKYEMHHRARLAVKPGITGMWQISGRSDIDDFEEVVRLDLEYINSWSLSLDIKILFKTVKQVLSGKGAM